MFVPIPPETRFPEMARVLSLHFSLGCLDPFCSTFVLLLIRALCPSIPTSLLLSCPFERLPSSVRFAICFCFSDFCYPTSLNQFAFQTLGLVPFLVNPRNTSGVPPKFGTSPPRFLLSAG